jgi:hypothetical protein
VGTIYEREVCLTRKDYAAVAAELRGVKPNSRSYIELQTWKTCCDAVAHGFAADNPRFDRDRFLAACDRY